jgi:hypothetical protein
MTGGFSWITTEDTESTEEERERRSSELKVQEKKSSEHAKPACGHPLRTDLKVGHYNARKSPEKNRSLTPRVRHPKQTYKEGRTRRGRLGRHP